MGGAILKLTSRQKQRKSMEKITFLPFTTVLPSFWRKWKRCLEISTNRSWLYNFWWVFLHTRQKMKGPNFVGQTIVYLELQMSTRNAFLRSCKCLKSFSFGGLCPPEPPTRGYTPRPHRGLQPLDPGSFSGLALSVKYNPCICSQIK